MSKLDTWINKIKDKQVGFLMNEAMIGEHEFEPGCGPKGAHSMKFEGAWGPKNILKWINPKDKSFLSQELKGTVTVDGLCNKAPMKGTLELRYFKDNKIRYTFEFNAKGKKYKYVGEKVNIHPWNLPVSHTTCFGRLTEIKTGKLVSTSVTHFRFRDIPSFMASLRLT